MSLYWDHNATSPLRPSVMNAYAEALQNLSGNPSSIHSEGQKARAALESARRTLAEALHVSAAEIIFMGSATEVNDSIIRDWWKSLRKKHPNKKTILTLATEHSSIRENLSQLAEQEGARIVHAPIDQNGVVVLTELEKILSTNDVLFATIGTANNESGVLQPMEILFKIFSRFKVPLHSDMVQAFGKIPLYLNKQCSAATIAFHKVGGPKGVAALWVNGEHSFEGVLRGGGQEKNRRSSTENLPAIVAAEALTSELKDILQNFQTQTLKARNTFEEKLTALIPSLRIIGKGAERLPNTSFTFLKGQRSDHWIMGLDEAGLQVSAGSACSSGLAVPSKVMLGLGYREEDAKAVLRFSLGSNATLDEVNTAIKALEAVRQRLVA